ncbi:MAG: hypothetical protein K2H45_12600 [Acetatifactor sp.]|nr:hypothetical protein [Acetatifactor sp.]
MMYTRIEEWLNEVLDQEVPAGTKAFCFNLYEDGENEWSMELIAASSFDPEDDDWGCDELTDFGTRDIPLSWEKEADWEEILADAASALKQYLAHGQYADVLKACEGVGVGFVEGDIEILYSR